MPSHLSAESNDPPPQAPSAFTARLLRIGPGRLIIRIVSFVLVVGGVIMLGGDLTPPPDFSSFLQPKNNAAQNFVLRHFAADYTLDRDSTEHSRVTVTETIKAVFPQTSDAKGIERDLPAQFGEQAVHTTVKSVQKDGQPSQYRLSSDGDLVHLVTSGPTVLTGSHTFTIRYVETELTTRQPSSDGTMLQDVLDWNVTGAQWRQPMAGVSITVRMSQKLADTLVSAPRYGVIWSLLSDTENLDRTTGTHGDVVFSGKYDDTLPAYGIIWMKFTFPAGTFAESPRSFLAWLRILAPFVPIALGIALLIVGLTARATRWRSAPGRGIVIAESRPQPGVSILLASRILGRRRRGLTAALIDLAVRKNLRLLRVNGPSDADAARSRTTRGWYEFEFLTSKGLGDDEKQLVDAVFGIGTSTGDRTTLAPVRITGSRLLRPALQQVMLSAWLRSLRDGYRRVPSGVLRDLLAWGALATTALQWGFSRQLAYDGVETLGWILFWVSVASAIVTFSAYLLGILTYPLTEKGAMAREHLLGIREYISVAEQQRIQFLQSPDGAIRRPVKGGDSVEVAVLNDPLLAYAVLFGQERQWRHVLDLASAGALPQGWWRPSDLERVPKS